MTKVLTTGYGPRVTPPRLAEVRRAYELIGSDVIEAIAHLATERQVVLLGRMEWVKPLVPSAQYIELLTNPGPSGYGLVAIDREALADRLLRDARFADRAKVQNGPDSQPAPRGARLLVCAADEECLAVTWSQPDLLAARPSP